MLTVQNITVTGVKSDSPSTTQQSFRLSNYPKKTFDSRLITKYNIV